MLQRVRGCSTRLVRAVLTALLDVCRVVDYAEPLIAAKTLVAVADCMAATPSATVLTVGCSAVRRAPPRPPVSLTTPPSAAAHSPRCSFPALPPLPPHSCAEGTCWFQLRFQFKLAARAPLESTAGDDVHHAAAQ